MICVVLMVIFLHFIIKLSDFYVRSGKSLIYDAAFSAMKAFRKQNSVGRFNSIYCLLWVNYEICSGLGLGSELQSKEKYSIGSSCTFGTGLVIYWGGCSGVKISYMSKPILHGRF